MLKVVSPIERTNGRPYKHVVFMISQKKKDKQRNYRRMSMQRTRSLLTHRFEVTVDHSYVLKAFEHDRVASCYASAHS
jgi:hypothetical protein